VVTKVSVGIDILYKFERSSWLLLAFKRYKAYLIVTGFLLKLEGTVDVALLTF